ncbi:hypothetical protein AWZ03_006781 [Drosophila navojoa]|uniref:Uncharacterized protein n=1 Tax=Drosophila navojoa TaxID=7232 RepID=A0A484BDG8_DRONA|nr:hypothetical protein AWZ03_006781 [Drosophila navojoa]
MRKHWTRARPRRAGPGEELSSVSGMDSIVRQKKSETCIQSALPRQMNVQQQQQQQEQEEQEDGNANVMPIPMADGRWSRSWRPFAGAARLRLLPMMYF